MFARPSARRRAARLQARGAEKDREMRRDPQRVRQTQPMQHAAKHAIVAKFRVGQHPGHGEPARPDLPQQGQRLAPFFLKPYRGGNPRPTAGGVGHPGRRQIQRGPEQIAAGPCPQRRGDGHLAIRDLAQRATVLARDAHRVRALFGKTRPVENQQAFAFRHDRAQPPPHGVGTPRGIGDEVLEGLVRSRVGHARQHRFHGFAPAVAEQPLDVAPQREHLRAMAEAHFEDLEPRHQSTQLRDRAAVGHHHAAYSTQRIIQEASDPLAN